MKGNLFKKESIITYILNPLSIYTLLYVFFLYDEIEGMKRCGAMNAISILKENVSFFVTG